METIIGLLFIILPFIFKLIGKNLEQAGQTDKARKIREISEAMGNDTVHAPDDEDEDEVLVKWLAPMLEAEQEPQPEPVMQQPVTPVYVPAEGQTAIKKTKQKSKPQARKPILVEETERKREKIDPKKLVVYSEIMKPKYTDY